MLDHIASADDRRVSSIFSLYEGWYVLSSIVGFPCFIRRGKKALQGREAVLRRSGTQEPRWTAYFLATETPLDGY